MEARLLVDADLDIARGAARARVRGAGDSFLVDLSPRMGLGAWLRGPDRAERRRLASTLHEALRRVGLTARIRIAGLPVARLGADPRWGAVARLLGVAPTPRDA